MTNVRSGGGAEAVDQRSEGGKEREGESERGRESAGRETNGAMTPCVCFFLLRNVWRREHSRPSVCVCVCAGVRVCVSSVHPSLRTFNELFLNNLSAPQILLDFFLHKSP